MWGLENGIFRTLHVSNRRKQRSRPPVERESVRNVVADLVDKAKKGDGKVMLGGNPDSSQKGSFCPTTIVDEFSNDNALVQVVQFGLALSGIN